MGLHLTRSRGQAISIGDGAILVTVEEVGSNFARLHIEAPPGVRIDRLDQAKPGLKSKRKGRGVGK